MVKNMGTYCKQYVKSDNESDFNMRNCIIRNNVTIQRNSEIDTGLNAILKGFCWDVQFENEIPRDICKHEILITLYTMAKLLLSLLFIVFHRWGEGRGGGNNTMQIRYMRVIIMLLTVLYVILL